MRASLYNRPAVGVSKYPEKQSKGRSGRPIERHVGMRRDAGEQTPRAAPLKLPLAESLSGLNCMHPELHPEKRMPGQVYRWGENFWQ